MKVFIIIIVSILGAGAVIAGGMLLRIALFPVNTASKLIDTAYDAQNKVLNADNAIYNYEWFKQQKASIDAAKIQYTNAVASHDLFKQSAGERKDWTFEDKTEDARLGAVELGLKNHTETLIADYNARASMATRNIFEDHVLPNYIDALTFIRK